MLLLFFLLVIHGQFAIDVSRIVVESHDRTTSVRDRLETFDLLRESLYDSSHDFHLNFHVEFDELIVFFVVLSPDIRPKKHFTYLIRKQKSSSSFLELTKNLTTHSFKFKSVLFSTCCSDTSSITRSLWWSSSSLSSRCASVELEFDESEFFEFCLLRLSCLLTILGITCCLCSLSGK